MKTRFEIILDCDFDLGQLMVFIALAVKILTLLIG